MTDHILDISRSCWAIPRSQRPEWTEGLVGDGALGSQGFLIGPSTQGHTTFPCWLGSIPCPSATGHFPFLSSSGATLWSPSSPHRTVPCRPQSLGGKLHKGQSLSQALGQEQPVSHHCGGREHAHTPSVAQLWGRTWGSGQRPVSRKDGWATSELGPGATLPAGHMWV